jgi:hypothetical protein
LHLISMVSVNEGNSRPHAGRMQIHTDDVRRFFSEGRVVARQLRFQTVWLQASLGQDALHGRLADAQLLGQFPARPVRTSVVRFLLHPPHDPVLDGLRLPYGGRLPFGPVNRCCSKRVLQRAMVAALVCILVSISR